MKVRSVIELSLKLAGRKHLLKIGSVTAIPVDS